MQFKVHTEYSISCDGHRMAVISKDVTGRRSFLQKFELKTFPENTAVPREEAFCLEDPFGEGTVTNFLEAMLEAAWALGLRPKGLKDQKDELAAVRYHLEDMRALALNRGP